MVGLTSIRNPLQVIVVAAGDRVECMGTAWDGLLAQMKALLCKVRLRVEQSEFVSQKIDPSLQHADFVGDFNLPELLVLLRSQLLLCRLSGR